MKVFFNGSYIDEQRASVAASVLSHRESHLGLAENMRVEGGAVCHFDLHFRRLLEGIKVLKIRPLDVRILRGILSRLITMNHLGQGSIRLRYWIEGNRNHRLLAHPFLIKPLPPSWQNGIELICGPSLHGGPEYLPARLKSKEMLSQWMCRLETQAWAEDGLRVTRRGLVAEGIWSNILAERQGILYTAPLYLGALEGVTRSLFIEEWSALGREVKQTPFTRYDLYTAEKVWVCSTLRGRLAVRKVDGRPIGALLARKAKALL